MGERESNGFGRAIANLVDVLVAQPFNLVKPTSAGFPAPWRYRTETGNDRSSRADEPPCGRSIGRKMCRVFRGGFCRSGKPPEGPDWPTAAAPSRSCRT